MWASGRSIRTVPPERRDPPGVRQARGDLTRERGRAAFLARLDGHDVAADLGLQRGGRAEGHEPPPVEDADPVRRVGLLEEVRREEDAPCRARREAREQRRQVAARAGVEAGRGLVEEEHGRLVEERLGDLHAAGEAARERLDEVACAVLEAERPEELADARRRGAPPEMP